MPSFNPSTEIELEEGLTKYEVQNMVGEWLMLKGFPAPSQPLVQLPGGGTTQFRGEIPADLTMLNDNQLGTLLGLISSWNDYVQYQLAEAHMNYVKAEKELELTAAKVRLNYRLDENSKKRPQQERDDFVFSDRRYVDAQSRMIYFEAIYRFVKAIGTSADLNFSAISRRITQKGQETDRGRREHNVNNMRPNPMFRNPQ